MFGYPEQPNILGYKQNRSHYAGLLSYVTFLLESSQSRGIETSEFKKKQNKTKKTPATSIKNDSQAWED
jgi:hypothetical protein